MISNIYPTIEVAPSVRTVFGFEQAIPGYCHAAILTALLLALWSGINPGP